MLGYLATTRYPSRAQAGHVRGFTRIRSKPLTRPRSNHPTFSLFFFVVQYKAFVVKVFDY